MRPDPRKFRDYKRLHERQCQTWDIDPAYPVIKTVGEAVGGKEATAWLILRHVAYYHLGSALRSFAEAPGPVLPDRLLTLPCGQERRGHRVPARLRKHWDSLLEHVAAAGGPVEWLTPRSRGTDGWREITRRALAVEGNGRYFAYKICELSAYALGTGITAPDAGHAFSSGPRKGLDVLYDDLPRGNSAGAVAVLDEVTADLQTRVGEPDVARVETSLCAMDGLNKGRVYLGIYIDRQQEDLDALPSDLTPAAYAARAQHIPHSYLGEHNGRQGVDKARRKAYRDTGQLLDWEMN